MARPQIENGHTQIANEILEQLMKVHLSPNQWQVLLCIIRKTYGYHKKTDYITNTQICESTGILAPHVSRALCLLEMMGIITRHGKIIGFQKDWERWKKLSKLVTNSNLPESATLNTELPEQVIIEKLPILQQKLPISTLKVTSALVTQKKKETTTKKEVESLKEYTDRVLIPRFPNLDFKVERQKFDTWWAEGDKKLQRPKTAFTNWCEKAEQFRLKDQISNNGKPSGRIPPDGVYHTIEELVGPVTYEDEETEAQP